MASAPAFWVGIQGSQLLKQRKGGDDELRSGHAELDVQKYHPSPNVKALPLLWSHAKKTVVMNLKRTIDSASALEGGSATIWRDEVPGWTRWHSSGLAIVDAHTRRLHVVSPIVCLL